MSIVVSTDVFCDRCGGHVHGTTGTRIRSRDARENAKHHGWAYVNDARRPGLVSMVDICPECQAHAS